MPLVDLRNRYRGDLFDEYLPFWARFGIDHERGGIFCSLDHDGTLVDDDKRVVFQGRGLWLYSALYNTFKLDECLEIAGGILDFLLKHGRDRYGDWVHTLDRDGTVRHPADGLGFSGVFVAEGLQEYFRATGEPRAMDLALESFSRFAELYDDRARRIPQWYLPCDFPGMRTLGHEEMTIRVLTQILRQISDPDLEARVAHSVHMVMERYWHPEHRLNNEVLTFDYGRTDDACAGFFYLGHSIVTSWIILDEAMRTRDRSLFDLAAQRLKRHLEVAWEEPYGGLVRGLHLEGGPTKDRMLWTQDEALVGTMILMEHTDLSWPQEWFERVDRYVEEKFRLRSHGHPGWILGSDREVNFEPTVSRKGNYHHPRQLLLNLLALERMIRRGGEGSGFWD